MGAKQLAPLHPDGHSHALSTAFQSPLLAGYLDVGASLLPTPYPSATIPSAG